MTMYVHRRHLQYIYKTVDVYCLKYLVHKSHTNTLEQYQSATLKRPKNAVHLFRSVCYFLYKVHSQCHYTVCPH